MDHTREDQTSLTRVKGVGKQQHLHTLQSYGIQPSLTMCSYLLLYSIVQVAWMISSVSNHNV